MDFFASEFRLLVGVDVFFAVCAMIIQPIINPEFLLFTSFLKSSVVSSHGVSVVGGGGLGLVGS